MASGAAAPVGVLVRAAAEGDAAAWDAIVERFARLVWGVARAHRLSASDAADVSQTVWLRLVEHLGRLREPEALAGWIATTARNESLRLLRQGGRELVDEEIEQRVDGTGSVPGPEGRLLEAERQHAVWSAVERLSPRCRSLLEVLATEPETSYADISGRLAMPIGSIGPTRSRCLQHLRRELGPSGVLEA
ncbi:RNA polymerase sigma factor (sigma-70 family) [Motilibacter rhizosphaerae]|uniref:RNA polymerase sigma factor (Sigma-70 family) n=1 Tax=Motilibacter rhizosphaerae TaxID=598652 RepID=A0A4Q7NGM4_9ACTN|nr:sigma-70 family RNA polymerase sigma factor [Motilibacter rhizosphaerae]RZS82982.1 RNA polymerase sigma factor (sigma-70 family) [Motilibacter rhizosphaerae]